MHNPGPPPTHHPGYVHVHPPGYLLPNIADATLRYTVHRPTSRFEPRHGQTGVRLGQTRQTKARLGQNSVKLALKQC